MSKAASEKDVRDAFSLPAREAAMAEPTKSGSRNSTVFTGYKGRLYHPQVVLIYWGSAWADAATEPSHAEFTAAVNALFTARTRVYWAWIANDGTLTGIHSIPTIMSEELVKACSYSDRN